MCWFVIGLLTDLLLLISPCHHPHGSPGDLLLCWDKKQERPLEIFTPNHHLIPTQNTWGPRCKPSFTLGTTEIQEDACGADAERRQALLAGDEESKTALNCCVSILEDSTF